MYVCACWCRYRLAGSDATCSSPEEASSASSESGSLELLLILHATVSATTCGAQTNASAQVERATRCNGRFDGRSHAPHEGAAVKVAVSCASAPAQRRCTRVRRNHRPLLAASGSWCGDTLCVRVRCNKLTRRGKAKGHKPSGGKAKGRGKAKGHKK